MNSVDRQINELRVQISNLSQLVAKLIIDVEILKSESLNRDQKSKVT